MRKSWPMFFFYLFRVFLLLVILAVVLPALASVYGIWFSSILHNDQKPNGNPLKVEQPGWSEFVMRLWSDGLGKE